MQFQNGRKHFFENPARQNERLIETFVVFGEECEIGNLRMESGKHSVVDRPELLGAFEARAT